MSRAEELQIIKMTSEGETLELNLTSYDLAVRIIDEQAEYIRVLEQRPSVVNCPFCYKELHLNKFVKVDGV